MAQNLIAKSWQAEIGCALRVFGADFPYLLPRFSGLSKPGRVFL
jgi:hypothetical protein